MGFEEFEGFWKVDSGTDAECAVNSLVTFVQTGGMDGPVTLLCVKSPSPYGEGTGVYKEGTIEVTFENKA